MNSLLSVNKKEKYGLLRLFTNALSRQEGKRLLEKTQPNTILSHTNFTHNFELRYLYLSNMCFIWRGCSFHNTRSQTN